MEEATQRRLEEELGIGCDLTYLFKFQYEKKFADKGSEHEYCWVYIGRSDDAVHCNRNEIASWCYIKPAALDRLLRNHPHWFTPWFRMEWRRIMAHHCEDLEALTSRPRWQAAQTIKMTG